MVIPDGWDPREDTGYPPSNELPAPDVVHVAGLPWAPLHERPDQWRQRQRCAWCAEVLSDQRASQKGPARTPWPPGTLVAEASIVETIDGMNARFTHRWMITETDTMPAGVLCSDREDDQ